jgi:hypothetical protein
MVFVTQLTISSIAWKLTEGKAVAKNRELLEQDFAKLLFGKG